MLITHAPWIRFACAMCYADIIAVRIMYIATGEWATYRYMFGLTRIQGRKYRFYPMGSQRPLSHSCDHSHSPYLCIYSSIQKDYFVIPSSGLNVSVRRIHMTSPCSTQTFAILFVGRFGCVIHQNVMTQAKV